MPLAFENLSKSAANSSGIFKNIRFIMLAKGRRNAPAVAAGDNGGRGAAAVNLLGLGPQRVQARLDAAAAAVNKRRTRGEMVEAMCCAEIFGCSAKKN